MNVVKRLFTKEYLLLGLILGFSLLLRMYYMLSIAHPPLIYDAHNYDVMTKQLLDNSLLGYDSTEPNAFTTPGYPLFLAVLYKIFGYSQTSPLMEVRIVQTVLSTINICLLYLLAKQISNKRVALMSALFLSVYPVAIWVPTTILTETLYTFLFLLYLNVQMIALNRKSLAINFFTGMVLASAVLVRPLIAPLIILPYIYCYMKSKDRFLIKGFLINAAGFVLVMLPWWIRNVIVLHKFVLFATQEDPLLRGTYPYEIGIENMPYSNQKQEAVRRLKEGFTKQPLLYLKWYTIGKFDWLYFKIYYYVDDKITTLRSLLPLHNFFVWFGWVGVINAAVNKEIRLTALYIIFITLAHQIFVATSRYAYPQMHLLILLTAYLLDILFFRNKAAFV